MRKLLVGLSAALLASASVPAFAQVTTTNYGWLKPTIGASANTWGNNLNGDLDGIDSTVFGVSGVANAACPKAGCTFTGGISGTTASFSAAVTFGLTSVHTGLATFNGGISDATTLSVTGLSTLSGGVTVGTQMLSSIGTAAAGGAYVTMRPTDLAAGKPELYFNKPTGNNLLWELDSYDTVSSGTATLDINLTGVVVSGSVQAVGGLFSNNGLNVTGGTVSLPSASIVNADLDTVNGSSGSCGSATSTCTFTTNAQGRITAQGSATIQPDTCSAGVNGYCKNAEGIITQWGVYDCGSSACWSSTSTIIINLPTTCPNGFFSTQATGYNPGGVSSPRTPTIIGVGGSPVNQLYVRGDGASDEGFYWSLVCH